MLLHLILQCSDAALKCFRCKPTFTNPDLIEYVRECTKYARPPSGKQCGNFRIFLSFRFYVKLFLENLEVLKIPFLAILRPLNFVNWVKNQPSKVQK